jgi:hypothetical protein
MIDERIATVAMIVRVSRNSLLPDIRIIRCPMLPANPVCMTPPPIMNNAAMVRTAGLEKPEIASSGVRIPVSIKTTTTPRATTSTLTHSVMKRKIAVERIARTIRISVVKFYPPESGICQVKGTGFSIYKVLEDCDVVCISCRGTCDRLGRKELT